uniref:eIF-4F 25 kDa subunit n=1 Tax=Caenorhabditis tropicalis TaxID=1561998 RepID=A0A1I7T5L5_9PELO
MNAITSMQEAADKFKPAKNLPILMEEIPLGVNDHPIQYSYTFSFFVRPTGKFDPEEYANYVQPVGIMKSVEQFWNIMVHFKKPTDMCDKADIHFFKTGIKPVWEDPANCKGGKWIIRLKKGLSTRIWENLLMAIIGEQFLVGDELCGAVCSIRNQEDIISLWNRNADDTPITNRIRETLRSVLELPQNTVLEYKRHDDCLRDQSSYRHTTKNICK